MWDRTIRLRTFVVTISFLVVIVVLALSLFYFATEKDASLTTGQSIENSLSSTTTDNADEDKQTISQVTTATEVVTTKISVSTTQELTATTATPSKTLEKKEVIFIGDSLLAQKDTPPALIPKLVANGWQQISINAQGCRANHTGKAACGAVTHFTTMLEEIEESSYDVNTSGDAVPGAHQDVLKSLYANNEPTLSKISDNDLNDSFRQADAVVISLGTNDDPNAEEMEAGIRLTTSAIENINPDIAIYWVKICSQGNVARGGGILNPLLEDLSQELAFELIDWASQCQASHQFDGVHYKPKGVEAFTDALASGIS